MNKHLLNFNLKFKFTFNGFIFGKTKNEFRINIYHMVF